MSLKEFFNLNKGTLRLKILASVVAMVVISLLGSVFSLYQITEVNRLLGSMNHVSIPLGKLFTQIQSDAEILHRELDRSLGYSHWKDPHWRPRPVPSWIQDVLLHEMNRVSELIRNESEWASPEMAHQWSVWEKQIFKKLESLNSQANQLYNALEAKDEALAHELYPTWVAAVNDWKKELQGSALEYEKHLRRNFDTTETRVAELRTNLELILVVVILMSLLMLWLGERALRPLGELTQLAREITRRGLRKEDKSLLPHVSLARSDEVSQLAREFHHMATALLEREKTVESQKKRLQEQNRLLRDMGELNQNILNSIDSILIVTDLDGKITKCNPVALKWLQASEDQLIGSNLIQWPEMELFLQQTFQKEHWLSELKKTEKPIRLGPIAVRNQVLGGHLMSLWESQGDVHGAILVVDDLTEEVDLQERLRQAENLAAVGRMSAQVAHEVRNPLHSIGLEAEMAAELAAQHGDQGLKNSLSSILASVDRLQKITENYLKLSRLSDGKKLSVDVGDVLASVLSIYAPACEAQGVQVIIEQEPCVRLSVWTDPGLLEQVLGNLLKNSLQALESGLSISPQIKWRLGNTEKGDLWMRIEDNGPGVSTEVREKLFTPFFTTRAQGTGLGLSFIKKVLEENDGQIRHIERPQGEGACFELILPLMTEELIEEELNYAENPTRG